MLYQWQNGAMHAVVLALTALWHAAAAWHFTVHPHRTLARTTRERPVNPLTAELFRFLGAQTLAHIVETALHAQRRRSEDDRAFFVE